MHILISNTPSLCLGIVYKSVSGKGRQSKNRWETHSFNSKMSYKGRKRCHTKREKRAMMAEIQLPTQLLDNEYTKPQAWLLCFEEIALILWKCLTIYLMFYEISQQLKCVLQGLKEVLFCLSKLIAIQWMGRILKFQVH